MPRIETYGDIGREAFGWVGQFVVNASIVILQKGTLVGYFMFITRQLDLVACANSDTFCEIKPFWAVLTVALIIPLMLNVNAR